MKRTLIVICLLAGIGQVLMAQQPEYRTLFGRDGNHSNGVYGALTFNYGMIDGQDALMTGIKGGWIIDHKLTLGIAGTGFMNDLRFTDKLKNDAVNLAGGYGGLLIEPIIAPFSPIHITFPVIIGAGGVAYVNYNWWNYENNQEPTVWDSDAFFVIEPGIEIEFNIVRFMRLAVGASYRHTSNVRLNNTDGDVLRGFNGGFSLKFGKF
jgi:hypothetical protein